jgi:hypothetical protein
MVDPRGGLRGECRVCSSSANPQAASLRSASAPSRRLAVEGALKISRRRMIRSVSRDGSHDLHLDRRKPSLSRVDRTETSWRLTAPAHSGR